MPDAIKADGKLTVVTTGGAAPLSLFATDNKTLIGSEVDLSQGRRRRTYALTARGRKEFAAQKREWQRFVSGMQAVIT